MEQDGASAVLGLHRNQENRSCHALPEAFFREDREDPPGDAFVVWQWTVLLDCKSFNQQDMLHSALIS